MLLCFWCEPQGNGGVIYGDREHWERSGLKLAGSILPFGRVGLQMPVGHEKKEGKKQDLQVRFQEQCQGWRYNSGVHHQIGFMAKRLDRNHACDASKGKQKTQG